MIVIIHSTNIYLGISMYQALCWILELSEQDKLRFQLEAYMVVGEAGIKQNTNLMNYKL